MSKVINAFTGDEMNCTPAAEQQVAANHPDSTLLVPKDDLWDLPRGNDFAALQGARLARLQQGST